MKKIFTTDKDIDHILKFDPEVPGTALKTSSPQPDLLAPHNLPAIPWPAGLGPVPKPYKQTPVAASPLPKADVLIVTLTVAEALALSDVLTPGNRSKTDWYPYTHNWETVFKPIVKKGAPALEEDRLGLWYLTQVGSKQVICFKSELHFARDGAKMPIKDLWLQLIAEVSPSLVITTGTAGGIGANIELGDVVISRKVRFDCQKTFASQPFKNQEFTCGKAIPLSKVPVANSSLMGVTTSWLPQSTRTAQIIIKEPAAYKVADVVTTDFFAFDDTTNYFKLQSLGVTVEMGDAVLGLACDSLGAKAPKWVAIRNASDPQIDGSLSYKDQVAMAGRIYEKYGYWTTVNSAIACWAVIAGL